MKHILDCSLTQDLTLTQECALKVALEQHHKLWQKHGNRCLTSVLKRTERYLYGTPSSLKAFDHKRPNNPAKYRSMMDYIYCSIFPIERAACMRYYAEEGPKLKNYMSPEQIDALDKYMLLCMKDAKREVHYGALLDWRVYAVMDSSSLKLLTNEQSRQTTAERAKRAFKDKTKQYIVNVTNDWCL